MLVGVLLEGLPSLNVLAPLLIPIAGKLGLSELHYALVLIIAIAIYSRSQDVKPSEEMRAARQ